MTNTKGANVANEGGGLWGGVSIPVLGVTGEKFSGKTLFLSTIDPQHTLMIDLERSSETYSIPYKKRLDLYEELGKRAKDGATPRAIDAWNWFRETMESVKPDEYRVIAVDPISDIEQGLTDWVYEHPERFGRTKAQYDRAGGLLFGDVKSYWKMMLGMLSSRCETFAFSTHMGFVWKGSSPTEQRKAKGKETLYELASLYIHLARKPDEKGRIAKEPSGVVAPPIGKSRIAVARMVDGELEIIPALPPRIPKCTPAEIRRYIASPPDPAKPRSGEALEPEPELTEDERLRLRNETAIAEKEAEELRASRVDRMAQAAREMAAQRAEAAAKAAAKPAATVVAYTNAPGPTATLTPAAPVAPTPASNGTNGHGDTALVPSTHDLCDRYRAKLKLTDEQWSGVLTKRGVKTTKELSAAQATEVLGNLQKKAVEAGLDEDVPF